MPGIDERTLEIRLFSVHPVLIHMGGFNHFSLKFLTSRTEILNASHLADSVFKIEKTLVFFGVRHFEPWMTDYNSVLDNDFKFC